MLYREWNFKLILILSLFNDRPLFHTMEFSTKAEATVFTDDRKERRLATFK